MQNVGLLTILTVVIVLTSGCRSAPKRTPLGVLYAQEIQKQKAAIQKGTGTEVAKVEKENQLEDRIRQADQLDERFVTALHGFREDMKDLTREANFWGLERVSMKRAGLFAGIAASALVVASPANAVWVAALSGFSGAVNGFSASTEVEGFSKSVIAAYVKPIADEVAYAAKSFSMSEVRQYMWSDANTAKFASAIQKQNQYVTTIEVARSRLSQPIVGSEAAQQEAERTIDKLIKELGARGNRQ